MTNVETLKILDEHGAIGVVSRFDTDETRTVCMSNSQLLQWAMKVDNKFNSEWTEIAVTPNMPMVAYEKTVEDHTHGIALAPGLEYEDYEELM